MEEIKSTIQEILRELEAKHKEAEAIPDLLFSLLESYIRDGEKPEARTREYIESLLKANLILEDQALAIRKILDFVK